ncbi:hypothetical protein [Lacticaseibacillus manihotivorans]|uniref:hypothetical protein n=1 Tax=Lacticaseibacillus manihotivorans TaxID=88233 RepID=UPI0006CFAFBF|nr:hypothetical protein [Lacticaseibacillus manihotivorans]
MGKQVFIEGEILLTDQIATVNFSGHSRIMKQTLILPTRIDVTGSTRLHFFALGIITRVDSRQMAARRTLAFCWPLS